MRDPLEGLTADGLITTGARYDRVADLFESVLSEAVVRVLCAAPTGSVYVYGSVATGVAVPRRSDVDLLTIGLPAERARQIGSELSSEHSDVCRGVEIAAAMERHFVGDHDEAYGGRVFLHHYCVHLAGPDLDRSTSGFPGDRRAARGFNGDIGRHATRWRHDVDRVEPATLGRHVGRKTLLAVAGLVSVHDATWTTDREHAAARWGQVHPELAGDLAELHAWADGTRVPTRRRLLQHLDTAVDVIVTQFSDRIGLWQT